VAADATEPVAGGGTRFKELGADYFERRNPERVKDRLVARLEKLGYKVSLERAA
jgi:hypothetical protein